MVGCLDRASLEGVWWIQHAELFGMIRGCANHAANLHKREAALLCKGSLNAKCRQSFKRADKIVVIHACILVKRRWMRWWVWWRC